MFVGVLTLGAVQGPRPDFLDLSPSPDGSFLRVEVCSMSGSSSVLDESENPSVLSSLIFGTPPSVLPPVPPVLFVPRVGVRNYLRTIRPSRGNYVDTMSRFSMSVM